MPEPPRSADLMVDRILDSPGLLDQVRSKPEETLRKLAADATRELPPPAYIADRWTYRIVVLALGFVAAAAIVGAIYLSAIANSAPAKIPDVLTALGAAAIGALAGLLAPSPK